MKVLTKLLDFFGHKSIVNLTQKYLLSSLFNMICNFTLRCKKTLKNVTFFFFSRFCENIFFWFSSEGMAEVTAFKLWRSDIFILKRSCDVIYGSISFDERFFDDLAVYC